MTAPTIHRLHVIACGVLTLDLKHVAESLGVDVSMEALPGGLHATPKDLRRRLQEAIDEASAQKKGDMIAIAYGICGLGTVGLHARNVPLAVPRVNDCIALFLGSDAAYREQFRKYPGTSYLPAGGVGGACTRGPRRIPPDRHPGGTITPNPACWSSGAASVRKAWAPAVSVSSAVGCAVSSACSISGNNRLA